MTKYDFDKMTNKIQYNSLIVFGIFQSVKKLKYYLKLSIPDFLYLKIKHKRKTGKKLNLSKPESFNDKLNWLKLYNRNSELSEFVDKIKVRDKIKGILGEKEAMKYLVPLIYTTRNVKDLTSENLPDYPFVVKSNHDQGGVIIVENKSNINYKKLKLFFKNRLLSDFYHINREWPYKNINRKILVEKKISDSPDDLKVYCFNGTPRIVFVRKYLNKYKEHKFNYFNSKGKPLYEEIIDDKLSTEVSVDQSVFEEAISLSKKLSKFFQFVRIDFLLTEDRLYIGEFTFFPQAGFKKNFSQKLQDEAGNWLNIESV